MSGDDHWMNTALALARRGLGRTWPNPSVGCVLVRNERLLAGGFTQTGGRPHAETEALRHVAVSGETAEGATAYVTLEPCSHHGKTPPCADALVLARIKRAVVAIADPDPRVSGAGLERLRQAGIDVTVGVGAKEAEATAQGFLTRIRLGRPMVTLKLATSLDGRIALSSGESRWITGAAARAHGHRLRATHDAIAVGIGTALADDPMLTCRLPGLGDLSPVRIVFDSRSRLPNTSRLVATATRIRTILLTARPAAATELRESGIEVLDVAGGDSGLDPRGALKLLGDLGLTRLLVEGGGRLAASLLRAGLVDRLAWYRAPLVIGGDGIPGVGAMAIASLLKARAFVRTGVQPLGEDLLETYVRTA